MLWLQDKQAEKLSECVGDTDELERLRLPQISEVLGDWTIRWRRHPWRSDTATAVEM